ncbi:MAG: hypothetical protein F082_1114 [bacterium F082]|nr:MAG: hypothetical protein F082_1114 [bacterium F082]KWW30598.1 MAG: hypothetical protein AUK64_721 [bacterium P201]
MRFCTRIILLCAAMFIAFTAKAQVFYNDFENRHEWMTPWFNLHIVADSSAAEENYVCICDSIHEFGLGFGINAGKDFPNQNVNCKFDFLFKADANTQAEIVVSIDDTIRNRYWAAYPLADYVNDTAEWSQVQLDLNFPASYTRGSEIKVYVWNKGKERLVFDDAKLEVKPLHLSFLPKSDSIVQKEYDKEKYFVLREDPYDKTSAPITYPLGMLEEYIIDGDTIREFNLFVNHPSFGDWISHSEISSTRFNFHRDKDRPGHEWEISLENWVSADNCKVVRQTLVIPFIDSTLTVYRRNLHIDSTLFQPEYYLDREGFTIGKGDRSFTLYHPTGNYSFRYASLQLDAENRIAYINLEYWRDHPLIHYPLCDTIEDYFEDISCEDLIVKPGRGLYIGRCIRQNIYVNIGDDIHDLPRLMPVWDGYQSAFIFTEHADWTDIRTHRAVLFGNENITKPEDAVGGFCYYDIPVTKSVFYWNPDNVTNEKTSKGLFKGPVASIKTDKEFYKLLKTIRKQGFEICLHSPEVYTTIPSEFPKAMRFMRRQFDTKSWIDHGYNNGPTKNREDLVCDGLLRNSPYYAADLWEKNGVRYLWNAYYEENRMEHYNFDSHFMQPYDGFGDALPNRQITTLPNSGKDFLLWSTSSTLEVNEDREWYYYFDSIRLQRLVDQHNVFITHVYPAWSNPYRAFWQYNENGTAVAMPGFNFALSQLARFRDEKKILPTTIEQYLSYYEKLLNIDYQIIDNKTISLTNHRESIEGLTLLCSKPITVEGKPIDFRKVDEGYLVWFDLKRNETVTIKLRE